MNYLVKLLHSTSFKVATTGTIFDEQVIFARRSIAIFDIVNTDNELSLQILSYQTGGTFFDWKVFFIIFLKMYSTDSMCKLLFLLHNSAL